MKAMILCGGKGTRLRELSEVLPKPMVMIGGRPIVWHIMKTYAAFGVKEFILCLGYKADVFKDYFLNYRYSNQDLTIDLGRESVTIHGDNHGEHDWKVTLAFTGEDAMTGARVLRASKYLGEDETFLLTYGDAVAKIDV
ncbi:glucose-1-phosphate cytidylyltransferase, partial [bacterium]